MNNIENLDNFRCEDCPLMGNCPFNGKWGTCKINELINNYEDIISNIEAMQDAYLLEMNDEVIADGDLPTDVICAYDEYKENV